MFRQPWWLAAGLAGTALAWALVYWAEKRRKVVTDALGRASTLARSADAGAARRTARARLRLAGIALLFVALAGPQFGVELVETRSDARQAVVAIDVSRSMLTPDVKPSRLERAKGSLSLLIEQLRGERVGVVAFAGEAQIVCPLTQDADAAKQLLAALDPSAVPTPGSSVGKAIRVGTSMLGRYPGSKSIVLLTDGEDHKSDPVGAAREAAAAGVRVYAIGIGTPEGEPIPGEGTTYHKDKKGSTVVSRLDEGSLAQIARESGGAYYRTSPGEDEVADIVKRIKEGEAAKGISGKANLWRDRYAFPAVLAFIVLLIELLLPVVFSTNSLGAVAVEPLKKVIAAFIVLLPFAVPSVAKAATAESELRAGNRLYSKEMYEEALGHYAESIRRRPGDARAAFNAGSTMYRLEHGDEASDTFQRLAENDKLDAGVRTDAYYNLGNTRYAMGDYAGAAKAYRGALTLSPSDADARHNLAVAYERMRNPPDPKKQKDQKKNEPDKPKDDKKDDPKGGGGDEGKNKQEPKTRPKDQLTKEEAERVLRAVGEREKQAQKDAAEAKARRATGRPPSEEDW